MKASFDVFLILCPIYAPSFTLFAVRKPKDGDQPYMYVAEAWLPSTSRHRLGATCNASDTINQEGLLTDEEISMLKSLGVGRAKYYLVCTVMKASFPGRKYDRNLIYRVMKKGRQYKRPKCTYNMYILHITCFIFKN